MSFTFAELAQLDAHDAIVLVQARDAEGQNIYAYLRMDKAHTKACAQAIRLNKPVDLESYGDVLECGMGNPDEETRRFMEEEYGFQH